MSHIDEVIDEVKHTLAEHNPWQIHKSKYKQPEFQVTKEVRSFYFSCCNMLVGCSTIPSPDHGDTEKIPCGGDSQAQEDTFPARSGCIN